MKKLTKILLIAIFPLGIIYCVGKNLFSGNFAAFLGAIFLMLAGFLLPLLLLIDSLPLDEALIYFVYCCIPGSRRMPTPV